MPNEENPYQQVPKRNSYLQTVAKDHYAKHHEAMLAMVSEGLDPTTICRPDQARHDEPTPSVRGRQRTTATRTGDVFGPYAAKLGERPLIRAVR